MPILNPEIVAQLPVIKLPSHRMVEPGCDSCGSSTASRQEAYRPHSQLDGNLQVDPEIHLPSPGMDVDIAYYYNAASAAEEA